MNLNHPLILASNSPRRQQIMRDAGFQFEVLTMQVDESFPGDLPVRDVAEYLAVKKNSAYQEKTKSKIIITADTTVILGNRILNKPKNVDEAIKMLQNLSNTCHEVVTGVCISIPAAKVISLSDTTKVWFRELNVEEVSHYVEKYSPLDKAGAYGIQEWIGMVGVEKIEGSFYNVVGLPVHRIYAQLRDLKV